VVVIAFVGAVISIAGVVYVQIQDRRVEDRQSLRVPFYTPPDGELGVPGDVIRLEPLRIEVVGARAFHMLYVSEQPDGTRAASGGIIFIPDGPAPAGGPPSLRKLLAQSARLTSALRRGATGH
jgi:hypothetical protein